MADVRAVERAIDILLSFTMERRSMSVSELQKRVDLSRGTLYRLLRTLEAKQLVRSFGDPLQFALDYRVFELGSVWSSRIDLAAVGGDILRRVRDESGETVSAFVPVSGCERLCVFEARSRQPLTFALGLGDRKPLAVGAAGRAILAYLEPDEIEAVARALPNQEQRKQLLAQLAAVREKGGVIALGEVIPDGFGVAVPVFQSGGQVAGSICVMGPSSRASEATLDQHLAMLQNAARDLSAALGHHDRPRSEAPPPPAPAKKRARPAPG